MFKLFFLIVLCMAQEEIVQSFISHTDTLLNYQSEDALQQLIVRIRNLSMT